uniref:Uncharacterized protein n=1 Tax=Anguilla anguilla TaxID=7936 RepID=A0A0E9XQ95_ANGAN
MNMKSFGWLRGKKLFGSESGIIGSLLISVPPVYMFEYC